jgi:hypothetical protein
LLHIPATKVRARSEGHVQKQQSATVNRHRYHQEANLEREGNAVCGEVVGPGVGKVVCEVVEGTLASGVVLCDETHEGNHSKATVLDLLYTIPGVHIYITLQYIT